MTHSTLYNHFKTYRINETLGVAYAVAGSGMVVAHYSFRSCAWDIVNFAMENPKKSSGIASRAQQLFPDFEKVYRLNNESQITILFFLEWEIKAGFADCDVAEMESWEPLPASV